MMLQVVKQHQLLLPQEKRRHSYHITIIGLLGLVWVIRVIRCYQGYSTILLFVLLP
jgi:hypothetical protein